MKKFSLLLMALLLSVVYANSQKIRISDGVVSPIAGGDSPAFIDGSTGADARDTTETTLKSKGLVFPRVNLSKITTIPNNPNPNNFPTYYDGMVVYNTQEGGTAGIGNTEGTLTRGFWYYENKTANKNGGTWKLLGSAWENTKWFYMPSIVIDVTTSGTFSRDLHLEYKKQFADTDNASTPPNSPTAGNTLVKSDSAPNLFNKIYAANELYFYVTGYDATVFSNLSITSAGVLTYTVNANNVSDATYMNIVFVIK